MMILYAEETRGKGLNAGRSFFRRGQTAIEYLLLLGAVVAVVLVAIRTLLPKTTQHSEKYFRKVSQGIMGQQAGNHLWDDGQVYDKARKRRMNYP